MNPVSNPFAPPDAPLDFPDYDDDVAIEGFKLVVPDGYVFPPICPLSGAVSGLEAPSTRRVSAHRPVIFLLLLLGPIPYIIGALLGARRGTFSCRLSTRVIARWRWIRIVGGLAFFASFYCFWKGITLRSLGLSFAAIAMLVIGFSAACGMFEGIKASAVRDGRLWLRGIPKRTREQIVLIEARRREAARKAAAAQWAASIKAAATPPPVPVQS